MAYNPTPPVPPPEGYSQGSPPPQTYPPPQGYPQQPPPAPYPPYSAGQPPTPPGAGFDFAALWKKLGLTGQVCSIAGLVLFLSFFFPWFGYSETCSGDCIGFVGFSGSASGFTVANGGTEGFSFAFLWLVLLGSLALIVLPIVAAMGKLAMKQAQLIILGVAGVALLFELIYMFQAFGALKDYTGSFTAGNTTVKVSAGPAFGFWLAVLATLVAGGVYLYFTYLKKPTVVSGYPQPYPQPTPSGLPDPSQQASYQQPGPYPGQYPGQPPPQYPGQ